LPEEDQNKEAARALIDEVFKRHPMPHLLRLETDHGLAVQFTVQTKRLAGLQCFYLVEPLAEALLRAYPVHSSAAYTMLATTLLSLPRGLHTGMENVSDFAELETIWADEAVRSFMDDGHIPKKPVNITARTTETLKKMDARNRLLVKPPSPGRDARVTVETITGVIGLLRGTGTADTEITPKAVAFTLGVTESAVSKTLKRRGVSFNQLVNMYE